jgi:hypothetical protein
LDTKVSAREVKDLTTVPEAVLNTSSDSPASTEDDESIANVNTQPQAEAELQTITVSYEFDNNTFLFIVIHLFNIAVVHVGTKSPRVKNSVTVA